MQTHRLLKKKTDLRFETELDQINRLIRSAETYEVAFQFPWDRYAVVIWYRLDADGTNIPSEEGPRLSIPRASVHNLWRKHRSLPACFEYACN